MYYIILFFYVNQMNQLRNVCCIFMCNSNEKSRFLYIHDTSIICRNFNIQQLKK